MKNLLLLCIALFNISYANNNYELRLYEKVLPSIFNAKYLSVFTDKHNKDILKSSSKFNIVKDCTKADFLMGKNFSELSKKCTNKPIFSTSYRGFKNIDNCFGAFYWRKGRPQIKFKINTMNRFNLKLPKELRKYAQ